MKKVFLFIVLVTVALASFSQKKYENSYVSVIVPNGWVVQNDGDKGMGTELMYFYNDEYDANIYNLGMIIGFNQFQKPEFMLETQMNLKSNPLFENADFGKMYNSIFMGKSVKAADFKTQIFNETFKGTAYAFNEGGCSVLAVGSYKVGTKSDLPKIWRTVKWKNIRKKSNVYASFREEIEAFCAATNKSLEQTPIVSDGEQFVSIYLEPDANIITNTYKFIDMEKSSFDEDRIEQIKQNLRPILLDILKATAKNAEIAAREMKEGYIFKYTYIDKNDEFLFSVKLTPDDYQ